MVIDEMYSNLVQFCILCIINIILWCVYFKISIVINFIVMLYHLLLISNHFSLPLKITCI